MLKRLDDAVADDDQILAVICGSAINNDGSQKVGYLAPSVDGQGRAVAEALAISGVNPESISYIEAHGTGTSVGDPIEVAALTQAYRAHTRKKQYVALGSVKGNIGHLGEAAGMAGIIKAILSLNHRRLPPSINYERPNPEIDFQNSPFFVNSELRDWRSESGPLRAGITALGAGGTNVHLILEEAPERKPLPPSTKPQLLLLSAKTSAALERATEELATHLEQHPELDLADVAHTLQIGRRQFPHRRALVAGSLTDAVDALRSADAKRLPTQVQQRGTPSVAFMFPGGGAQYATMGAELYQTESVYRSAFDECLAALQPSHAAQVRSLVLASAEGQVAASAELERPSLALPALFATEYATAKLLMGWASRPSRSSATAWVNTSRPHYQAYFLRVMACCSWPPAGAYSRPCQPEVCSASSCPKRNCARCSALVCRLLRSTVHNCASRPARSMPSMSSSESSLRARSARLGFTLRSLRTRRCLRRFWPSSRHSWPRSASERP